MKYREAVAAIDRGDLAALQALLDAHPSLATKRIDGYANEAYFSNPYLLWFVAGNPVREERLPHNIGAITRLLLERNPHAEIDYTLELVCSGRVPRETGVQRELMDILVDAGANPDSAIPTAVAHRERDAVEHLLERGARLSLLAAIGTERTGEIARLAAEATPHEKQCAMIAAAMHGQPETLELLIRAGADVNQYGPEGFHPHASPLHQAVFSGSLDAVKLLVEAGADLDAPDRAYKSTPLGWAEYGEQLEIAAFLRQK